MIKELLMPSLSPTMEEGTLVSWNIKPGDTIAAGDVLGEIQTDKAVVEWESLEAGTVSELLIDAGSHFKVNMVASVLTTKDGEDPAEAIEKAKKTNEDMLAADAAPAAEEKPVAPAAPAAVKPPSVSPSLPPAPAAPKGNIRVSPVAARMAAKNSIDLSQVKGTGTDGRIVKRDIEAAIASGSARIGAVAAGPKPKPKIAISRPDASDENIGLTPMRAIIGERLLESKTTIPHFYCTEKIDVCKLVSLREQLNSVEGVKVTFNDLVTKACAITLRKHRSVNATYHGQSVVKHDSVDISIAVAIPDGLITPILFAAHTKSVTEIGAEVRTLAKKAMGGKLQPEEFQGGTFTISNLGMFGIEEFMAIVNPPQAAILAVGGIKDEPVVKGGAVVPGKTMRVTLSCDHRVVDGADAAAFLKDLRILLETPAALLL